MLVIHTAFSLKSSEWETFLKDLVKFTGEEKLTRYYHLIKSDDMTTRICIAYVFLGCSIYGLVDRKEVTKCFKIKEEYNLDQLLCGMFVPLWLPFPVYKLFVPVLYLLQYISSSMGLLCGAMAAFLTWQAARVLGLHIDILNEEFDNLFKDKDNFNKNRFKKWIQYHNHITRSV